MGRAVHIAQRGAPFTGEIQSDRTTALVGSTPTRRGSPTSRAAGFVEEQLSERQVWRRPADVVEAVRRGRSAAAALCRR